MTAIVADPRTRLLQRGRLLNYVTLLYMIIEGGVALIAGVAARSAALVGFGIDSLIELGAALTALWRLAIDGDTARRDRVERITLRMTGGCLLLLAGYVGTTAVHGLVTHSAPAHSTVGILLAAASAVVMPSLGRAKRRIGLSLASGSLVAEARQADVCAYLAATLLVGLLCNELLSWWWADPAAALGMVPLIACEGYQGLRGRSVCTDGCASSASIG